MIKRFRKFILDSTRESKQDKKLRREEYKEIMSAIIINNFLNFDFYYPYTSSSLNFSSLLYVLNDITINSRRSVLEFGTGYSTVVISKMLSSIDVPCKLISVEENEKWSDKIREIILCEKLSNIATIVHAPISGTNFDLPERSWYDREQLARELGNAHFDCVIVDGPAAWKKEWQMRRYGAGPFLQERLSSEYTIFLDDADRPGEQEVIRSWKTKFDWHLEMISTTLARFVKGQSGNILW